MGNRHFRSNTIWRISRDFDFHTLSWHWHQEIEFIYVHNGEVQCYIGKDRFSLPAGSGLFINTKIIHQFTAEQPTLIPNIVFSPLLLASTESFIYQQYIKPVLTSNVAFLVFEPDTLWHKEILATVYKGNIIKNLIMDCQSYTKYRPNETTGGIFVSWRRKEELPTGA